MLDEEEEEKEYIGIHRKEQTATALLGLTRLSVCLFYHYRFYSWRLQDTRVKEGKQESIVGKKVKDVIGEVEREIQLSNTKTKKGYAGPKYVI